MANRTFSYVFFLPCNSFNYLSSKNSYNGFYLYIDLSDVKSSYVPFAFDMRRKSLQTISVIKVFDYVLSPRKH